jgi:hypothetical protein
MKHTYDAALGYMSNILHTYVQVAINKFCFVVEIVIALFCFLKGQGIKVTYAY